MILSEGAGAIVVAREGPITIEALTRAAVTESERKRRKF